MTIQELAKKLSWDDLQCNDKIKKATYDLLNVVKPAKSSYSVCAENNTVTLWDATLRTKVKPHNIPIHEWAAMHIIDMYIRDYGEHKVLLDIITEIEKIAFKK